MREWTNNLRSDYLCAARQREDLDVQHKQHLCADVLNGGSRHLASSAVGGYLNKNLLREV